MTQGHNINAQLQSVVERIERLEAEKATIAEDIKQVYSEAKANGFDTKTLRKVIGIRKKTMEQRLEEQAMIDTYLSALGDLADTPLGAAAMARDLG